VGQYSSGAHSVVFVASQLGHSSPAVTLNVYAHPFDERDHAERTAAILEGGFGNIPETATHGDARSDAVPGPADSAALRAVTAGRG
jgi:hypothetical protein